MNFGVDRLLADRQLQKPFAGRRVALLEREQPLRQHRKLAVRFHAEQLDHRHVCQFSAHARLRLRVKKSNWSSMTPTGRSLQVSIPRVYVAWAWARVAGTAPRSASSYR